MNPLSAIQAKTTRVSQRIALEWEALTKKVNPADISFFHEFAPPPTGGGHQFMRALMQEFQRQKRVVENNTLSSSTQACLFNSFNFDPARLRRFRKKGCRYVHRVDGPIATYRGTDDGTDQRIADLNQEFADATIFQSQYSVDKHRELGFNLRAPFLIPNAVDPTFFHLEGRKKWNPEQTCKIISVSWSDNPNKGAAIYKWLDEHLDWSRFSYTFIGRIKEQFRHIQVIDPSASDVIAKHLRESDIYLTASRHDPCSNSLLEALHCGLPAVYLNSGGHAELVKSAGFAFDKEKEIPDLLEQLCIDYLEKQNQINVLSLQDIAQKYLEVMLPHTQKTQDTPKLS